MDRRSLHITGFMRGFFAFPVVALFATQSALASAPVVSPPIAVVAPRLQTWAPIRDEHVKAARPTGRTLRFVDQMPAPIKAVTVGHALVAPKNNYLGNAFLTRPYMNYHMATSVFDHCNPDYSIDGQVCREDGVIGYSAYGVDPSFSKGYAATRGGSDYVYYDGHNGWDMALNYENVLAAADGVVKIAGIDSVNTCFGQNVVIDHGNGFSTRYGHLSQIYVAQGASVTRGQVIGVSGNTGCSSGPHLHFGVYVTSSWNAIDPFGWEGSYTDPWPYDQGDLWLTGNPANPLPSAPGNLTATAGTQSAALVWSAPPFDGGSPISNYTVTSSPGGLTATVPGTQLTAVVNGLTPGTPYTFTVVAVNGVGASSASNQSNSIVPLSTPGPPLNVSAAPGNRSISVSWSAPALIGGSPITAYQVASATGGLTQTVSSGTSAVFSGLNSSAPTSFTVTAVNASGAGAASAASNSVAAYPVNSMFTLEAFGGIHADAASPAEGITAYWSNWKIARSSALLPDGSGGYVLDGYGGLHSFGQASAAPLSPYWANWDIARDVVLLPGSTASHPQGYVLEGYGGLHPFGGAPAVRLTTYWPGWDIARRAVLLSDGTGGYVMDGYGGLHAFAVGANPMPPNITNAAYWHGWTIVRDIALAPDSTAGNVAGVTLDGYGGVHPFGTAGAVTDEAYWGGWDIARSVQFAPGSTAGHPQGWVLDGYGGLHPFGGAAGVPGASWPNNDVAIKLMAR